MNFYFEGIKKETVEDKFIDGQEILLNSFIHNFKGVFVFIFKFCLNLMDAGE